MAYICTSFECKTSVFWYVLMQVGNLPFVQRYRKGKKKTFFGECCTY
jgi:hypothetical protein